MRIGLVSVIAFSMTASAMAMAQEPPTGSRLGSRYSGSIKYSEEEADTAATKMASCMVAKREAAARGYLAAYSVDESDKQHNELFKYIFCMSFVGISEMSDTALMTFPEDVFRGKLAEAFLKSQSNEVPTLPALPLEKDCSRPWFAATGRNPVIDEMGVCVADTNPKGVAGILATQGYSKEEAAAFGAVMPSLGTCLRAGAKLKANRQALRAALADALYQRLTRPAPSAQVTEAEAATRQARTEFKKFAECVVAKYRRDANVYIIEDLSERSFELVRNKMRDEACWRATTGTQPPVPSTGLNLQGMIAEVLLAAEGGTKPLPEVKAIPPLKQYPLTEKQRQQAVPETLPAMEAMAQLFVAGECVVRADAIGAYGLLNSGLATTQESEALAALKPAFASCIKRDLGHTVSPAELRAAVAVNYYRLAHAPRVATASAGGAK
jgi:hypothetical protein